MGRRGDHSYKELTQLIIDSAFELMVTEGIEKVSTRKIAAKIGYTVGTLYNIFQNLDDIYVHINSLTLDKLITEFEKTLKSSNKESSKIKALAQTYINFSRENFNIWSLVFEYRFPESHQKPRWYNEKILKLFGMLNTAIAEEYPKLDDAEIKTAVGVVWSGVHGICTLSLRGKLLRAGVEEANVLIDSLVDNYFANLTAKH